jgi:hypothetical protein
MIFMKPFAKYTIRQKKTRLFWFSLLFLIAPTLFCTNVCANPSNEKHVTITILKNDNLVTICKKYLEQPNDWKKIARINQLENPHLIYPGKTLQIPSILLKGIPIDGMVTFLKGSVMSKPPDGTDWTGLHMEDLVSQGTQLKTGTKSALEITFEDGASFFLRSETTISIQTARKKATHYIIRKLFMPVGRTLMNIKKATGQESRFEIQTPSAVSAARGTSFRVSADKDDITRTEVLGGIVGVTAKGQEIRLDQGEGTWTKKGQAPKPPTALLLPPSPVDLKAIYQVLPSQFKLIPVDNAVSYRVMLSADPVFKDVVKTMVVVGSAAVSLENLEDGTYYCQTRSIDRVGLEGIPSQPTAFEIRVNPLPPFIQKPLAGQKFRKETATLEWLNVPDAKTYQIQVAKDPEFRKIFMDVEGVTQTRKTIQLDDFSDYYFRVRSVALDQFKGVWSDTIGFTFLEPPKAPPVEAPQMDESTVNIRWQDVGPDISYRFQMAADPLFKDIIKDSITEKPFIAFETPKKSGTYHIRISAIDSQGYEGKFTPAQTFQIKGSRFWEISAVISVIALIIIL